MSQLNQSNQPSVSKAQPKRMPDTLVILFFVALFAAVIAWLVPAGSFDTELVVQETASGTVERQLLIADSFQYQDDPRQGFRWFAEGGEIGLANVPFEGMVSGSKWGAAIGVMAFIILVGGAFGIILATNSIERGILHLIHRTKRLEQGFLAIMFVLFSLGGAIFGMGEEAIAFCLVLLPVLQRLGYDAITTVLITYVATQIGFATSWMNPFSVAIAQGIAEVPLLSGSGYRMALWVVFTSTALIYTLRYARRIRQPVDTNAITEQADENTANQAPFNYLDNLILLTFAAGLVWVIWGVVARGYYIPEIASQFLTMGVVIGLLAIVGKRLAANDVADAFIKGAQQLLPAALIVGFAKGIILLLGGDDPTSPTTLNTLLYLAGQSVNSLSEGAAAIAMLVLQSGFNFFVTSGSGQAALMMPLMAPLADLTGVSRQVAVLAFQLGDGLTNLIVPTSAALIGCLGAVRLDWGTWFRFIWRLQLLLAGLAIMSMLVAVWIGFV